MRPKKDETAEQRARRWCAIVENIGNAALSREHISYEDPPPEKAKKRKRKGVSPNTDTSPSEDSVELEKQFKITGTRVIMPEDRSHLEAEVKRLRPAFDAVSNHIKRSNITLNDFESLFKRLEELIVASYYIGAYTTVSLGAQDFVTPAVLRNKVKTPQRAKSIIDLEKRKRLRAAIMKAAGRRELKGSIDFAQRIHSKVADELVSDIDKWPRPKTIKNEILLMNATKAPRK